MVASRVSALRILLVIAAIAPPARGADDAPASSRRTPAAPLIRMEVPDRRPPAPKRPASPAGARPMAQAPSGSWRASPPGDGRAPSPRVEDEPAGRRPTPRIDEPSADAAVTAAAAGTGDPIADAALRFEAATARSRRRDHEVDEIRARLMKARVATDLGYDARGYLQASSRQVDGQKVHALIGPQGVPVAYLDIPPGIPTARLLARRVGVRGSIRFNESLGARLIKVRDLEPLDEEP
ncbi:hypothetical protein TA3x_005323 [Tundrisphaera sp. TA3]|uniref:hypothetical protein n=1 Tax=Tundrisphaera sp. TA3 TaxID=3435775 RepID=UPI003EBF5C28